MVIAFAEAARRFRTDVVAPVVAAIGAHAGTERGVGDLAAVFFTLQSHDVTVADGEHPAGAELQRLVSPVERHDAACHGHHDMVAERTVHDGHVRHLYRRTEHAVRADHPGEEMLAAAHHRDDARRAVGGQHLGHVFGDDDEIPAVGVDAQHVAPDADHDRAVELDQGVRQAGQRHVPR